MKYCLFLLLAVGSGALGSKVELNDTYLRMIPPFYALDEWADCQGPKDRYCIVDATLDSRDNSPKLQFLKDYSAEKLKHFNRTQIHRGMCVSRCHRNDSDWYEAAQRCVNENVQKYDLEAKVTSVAWCTGKEVEDTSFTTVSRALAGVTIALLLIIFVATVLHVMGERRGNYKGNKYLMAFSLKKNWEILTYDKSKPRQDDRMKSIAPLEGVRVLGMNSVIFTHVVLIYVYSFVDNPEFIERVYDNFVWKVILNSPLWLQVFFAMSGFLMSYVTLIVTEKRPMTLVNCFLSIINRYIRLTPLSAYALAFTIAWYPMLGSGPQWAWVVQRESHDCGDRWWHHILYIHNFIKLGKFCMGHTWYLAADMQFHVVGVFLMYVLLRWRALVKPVLALLMAASAIAAGTVTYLNDLTPIATAQSPEDLRTLYLESRILPMLYLPSWMNLPGYIGGIATGFIFYHIQQEGIKLSEKKWFSTLFHLSLHAGGAVVLVGAAFMSDTRAPRWLSAGYAAVDRTLVALAFCCFMLGMFVGCRSAIAKFMSWRGFHMMGRLSFCGYICHFIVLRLVSANNTQIAHASVFSMLSLVIVGSVLTNIVAVPLCLMIELPSIQLWKALLEPAPRQPEPEPEAGNQKFDLVANISRGVEAPRYTTT